MNILEILETPEVELYPEDFEMLEVELDTGDYTEEYREECREKLAVLRQLAGKKSELVPTVEKVVTDKKHDEKHIEPEVAPVPAVAEELPKASLTIFDEIKNLRQRSTYKAEFNKLLTKVKEIDGKFADVNFNFLTSWEIKTILRRRQVGEEFLEKHFLALDHSTISKYQTFSESFFMRHFDQLDCELVLQKGKNPWKEKDKRSKQLTVFLRLRGVKI